MQPIPKQLNALCEMINIGVGRGAGVLNTMLRSHISIRIPSVTVFPVGELGQHLTYSSNDTIASVQMGFSGPVTGRAMLVFSSDCASQLVSLLTGDRTNSSDLDGIRTGTLNEVGNVVINEVMGAISNMLSMHLNYVVPTFWEGHPNTLLPDVSQYEMRVLLANIRFEVMDASLRGDIVLFFEATSFEAMVGAFASGS